MANHICFTVADRSYFALLKKEIKAVATQAGFSEGKVGEIEIIVAEIVSNLVKHGGGGKLLVKPIRQDNIDGIELIGIDNGDGIPDLGRMMNDGVSTTNTLGQGLGAIKRLSTFFQIYTQRGWGTIVLSRVLKETPGYTKRGNEIRTVIVPKPGEVKSGDGFFCNIDNDEVRVFLGDGLGHGEEAFVAVNAAIDAYKSCTETSAVESIRHIHQQVKKTRGLVGTIAQYSAKEKQWNICGIGNILTRFINGIDVKNHMSYNGIIGYNIPNSIKDHEYQASEVQVMVMCSDGIKTKWDLMKYPGLLKYDLTILAAVLYKDFGRQTDDMAIAAIKLNY